MLSANRKLVTNVEGSNFSPPCFSVAPVKLSILGECSPSSCTAPSTSPSKKNLSCVTIIDHLFPIFLLGSQTKKKKGFFSQNLGFRPIPSLSSFSTLSQGNFFPPLVSYFGPLFFVLSFPPLSLSVVGGQCGELSPVLCLVAGLVVVALEEEK